MNPVYEAVDRLCAGYDLEIHRLRVENEKLRAGFMQAVDKLREYGATCDGTKCAICTALPLVEDYG